MMGNHSCGSGREEVYWLREETVQTNVFKLTSAFISFLVVYLWQRSYWEPLVQVYKGSAVIVVFFFYLM